MTTRSSHWRPQTIAIHTGYDPETTTGAISPPIYQTVGYAFESTTHAAQLFSLDQPGNIYTRIMNPTTGVLEQRIAALEGGIAAVAFSSGMAAITAAVLNVCRSGDELIAATSLYGGTWTLFTSTLQDYGITVRFVPDDKLSQASQLVTEKTRAVYVESIGNPRLNVTDLRQWASFAHNHGLPLIVDNTFPTPYLERPIDFGADVVVHSLTKWIGGHGNSIGGMVVDSGKFNYNTAQYPQFSEPDQSYHGKVLGTDFGDAGYAVRLRVKLLRDTGAALAPHSAYLILLGLETLVIRMQQACRNALELAQRLTAHPEVSWVNYPGLESDPAFPLATQYLRAGHFGSMLNFGVKGGRKAALQVMDHLKLWLIVANVGDSRSMAIHPATTTHQQLSREEQELAGAGPDLIRLSVGLEHIDDLWDDLSNALNSI